MARSATGMVSQYSQVRDWALGFPSSFLALPYAPVLHRISGNQTFIPGLKTTPRFGEVFWVRCPKNVNEGILRFSFQANAEPYLE